MTSIERVLTALKYQEPDRVPFFLTLTMHGAKELQIPIQEYLSKGENVAEGQVRLLNKFHSDCVMGFFHISLEHEAFGGELQYFEDGAPLAKEPIIYKPEEIMRLEPPRVSESPSLKKVIRAIELLKEKVGGETVIVGLATSPFSLPVMQLGFEGYIELLYERPDLFDRLMKVNEEFAVEWANAQLAAGATIVAYFDPLASPDNVTKELYLKTGFQVAKRTIARINGPTATLLAGSRSFNVVDELIETGTMAIGTTNLEDLGEVKKRCQARVGVLGNLNDVAMRRWTPDQVEVAVKNAIAKAGRGGGYILADSSGDLPWQISDEVLFAISEAVEKWGRYPLDWVLDYAA